MIDIEQNEDEIISYTLGVKSLDGNGPQKRDFQLSAPQKADENVVLFTLKDNDEATTMASCFNNDIYRLSVKVEGEGWKSEIVNELAALETGEETSIPVYFECTDEASDMAKITLTAVSESDPENQVTTSFQVEK